MIWPIGPETSISAGEAGEAAAEQQAEPDDLGAREAGEAGGGRGLTHDLDLEADDRARHHHPGPDRHRKREQRT